MGKYDEEAAKWEPYRAEIRRLYVTERRELPDVRAFMEKEHSFKRSREQYKRKFKEWEFSKYLKQKDCEYLGYQQKKRKFEGKDTEYHVHGSVLSTDELPKKLRRRLPDSYETIPLSENGPPTPEGIQVLTPPARNDEFHIELAHLPIFKFQQFLRQTTFIKELSSRHFDLSTIPTDAILSAAPNKSEKDPARFLEAVTIGQVGEEPYYSSAALIHGPPVDALFYTISYCAYLSSNSLLPDRVLDRIVKWMMVHARQLPLFDFMKCSSATTVIFMRQLLGSAARLGYANFMHSLFQICLSFEDPGRILRSSPLLFTAIGHNNLELATRVLDYGVCLEKFPYTLDFIVEEGHDKMFELLLSRGLRLNNPDILDGESWLEVAIRYGRISIVKLLLEANAYDLEDLCERTFFKALVQNGDIAQLLVRAGKNTDIEFHLDYDQISSYMLGEVPFFYPIQTPLQVAAQAGNWELVRCLVEHGATIDLDLGYVNEAECEKWVSTIEDDFPLTDAIPIVSALQAAVEVGDIDMTLFLLHKGARVDARPQGKYGHTALQISVATGNKDFVNLLLGWGADVNATPSFYKGSTALQFAAGLQDLWIFRKLLEKGAELGAKAGRGGKTVLQNAAYVGNLKLVQSLIQRYRINVNEPPDAEGGRTALQAATESQAGSSLDIMILLLSAGADSNAPPARKLGITALQGAAATGDIAKARLLLSANAKLEVCSEQYGCTALHKAIENRHPEMVAFLLQSGATPHYGASWETGRTPLQEACWNGNADIASLLLSNSVPTLRTILVNYPASFDDGVTALQAAIGSGNLELTRLLLNAGANPNAPGAAIVGKTALETAIIFPDLKALRFLLKNGARFPLDWETLPQSFEDRHTLLFDCSHFRDLVRKRLKFRFSKRGDVADLISLVVGSGLDIEIFPEVLIGATLSHAIERRLLHVIEVIISSRVLPIDSEICEDFNGLQLSASEGYMQSVELFVDRGANVNQLGFGIWGRPALWCAVQNGHVEVVQYLLGHGANVEASSGHQTVLQLASEKGLTDIVRYLVEHGRAVIDAPGLGKFSRTALQAAAENGHVEIMRYLLERGADVNAAPVPGGGVTALQAAAIRGHASIVLLLVEAGADVTAPGAAEMGRTAIEGAAEHGRLDILHMLLQLHPRGRNLDDQLKRAEDLLDGYQCTVVADFETLIDKSEILRIIREYRGKREWEGEFFTA
ncbi:hypothetical protein FQN54_009659 [Arachnomyces sp. PD_36]|nr:hypothetical protein FQN54_009659 [Arachnomyces sp. PD_36]